MTNEIILRFTCAILIIIALFLLFLWRVAAEDAGHYKSQAEFNAEAVAKLEGQYYEMLSKIEKTIIKPLQQ